MNKGIEKALHRLAHDTEHGFEEILIDLAENAFKAGWTNGFQGMEQYSWEEQQEIDWRNYAQKD